MLGRNGEGKVVSELRDGLATWKAPAEADEGAPAEVDKEAPGEPPGESAAP